MKTPSRLDNPWIANAVVVSGFLLMVALSFGIYWVWSGGREKMISTRMERPAIPSAAAPSSSAASGAGSPLPLQTDPIASAAFQLERGDEDERLAAVARLEKGDDRRSVPPLRKAMANDPSEKVRRAAANALRAKGLNH